VSGKVVRIYRGVVLIAEDDPLMREILEDIIKEHFKRFSVVAVNDGEEALQYLNKNTPSLLILNMMMPRKSVGEVLRELSNRSERFPILVVSGWVESKKQVSELGQISGDRFEFLIKPFKVKDMVGVVKKMLLRYGND